MARAVRPAGPRRPRSCAATTPPPGTDAVGRTPDLSGSITLIGPDDALQITEGSITADTASIADVGALEFLVVLARA